MCIYICWALEQENPKMIRCPQNVGCTIPDVAKVDFTAREFQIGRFLRVGCFKMLIY